MAKTPDPSLSTDVGLNTWNRSLQPLRRCNGVCGGAFSPFSKDPTVCVVAPNWNGWRDTIACLDGLAQSTYTNLHIVVVDNGSTDNSVKVISCAYPNPSLLQTGQTLGFAVGNNPGFDMISSKMPSLYGC